MTDYAALLEALDRSRVEFILVGGAAATAHGSSRLTMDLDIVYAREYDNIQRLVASLASFQPYLRGAPPGLPYHWDVETVQRGLNFTLTTTSGAIVLLGETAGGGSYANLLKDTLVIRLFGIECQCLSLERLIHVKRAAGRPKDLEVIAELEAILEERRSRGEP